jgi:hypothetical protein
MTVLVQLKSYKVGTHLLIAKKSIVIHKWFMSSILNAIKTEMKEFKYEHKNPVHIDIAKFKKI